MGVERRGRTIQGEDCSGNQGNPGRDRADEPKQGEKPFDISKREVWDAGPVETAPKAASVRMVHLAAPGLEVVRKHLAGRGPMLRTARLFVRPDGTELRAHYQHAAASRDAEVARRMGASASPSGRNGTRRSTRFPGRGQAALAGT